MEEGLNDSVFDRIHRILDGTEDLKPKVNKIGVKRVDRENRRHETIHNSINYLEQARRFLKGAEEHDSALAYRLADDSLDDLQQNLQMLATPYPDRVQMVRELIPKIWDQKRRVYEKVSEDVDGIAYREYNKVLLDTRDKDALKPVKDKTIDFEETKTYRPTYWD